MTGNITIVRPVYSGLSQRQAATTHASCVSKYRFAPRSACQSPGMAHPGRLEPPGNATFSKILMEPTSPSRDVTFKMPDYEHVYAELAKPHVTLKLLWEEYVEKCGDSSDRFYMETQFRRYYHKSARVHKATIRLEHKPALLLEVDWAGTKISFFDSEIGKMSEASLFVSVLPCGQLICAEQICF